MKQVKIVIGANYGDEGKGLVTRYFAKNAKKPIIILHNGSVQRGHTINYEPKEPNGPVMRHVFHHFGVGATEGVPTYYADSFLVNPMEYAAEFKEIQEVFGFQPTWGYYSPNCMVITPFDMLVDQVTKIWIETTTGEKSYGTCGYGTWCAVEDRLKNGKTAYTLDEIQYMTWEKMDAIWAECLNILYTRGVELDKMPSLKAMFTEQAKENAIKHFQKDLIFFYSKNTQYSYNQIWKIFETHIFEGGQGLGLDKNVNNKYHTTSNTGLTNPYYMLNKKIFDAEVCYVTRSYLTRHGDGPLENEIDSKVLNSNIVDPTNCYNKYQGPLRYGLIDDELQKKRIDKDYTLVENDSRFRKTLAVTHINEYPSDLTWNYYSDNRYTLYKVK